MSGTEEAPPGVDVSVPSAARLYDYYLGGELNYPADRAAGAEVTEKVPEIRDVAWSNRGFLQRAVRWVAQQGVNQFVDVGAGLPTQNNTHQVARAVRSDARVVYVDHDPIVRLHANALLAGDEQTTVLLRDMRDAEAVLDDPATQDLIDFSKPVAVLLVAVTHFLSDDEDPWGLVARYLRRLVPGSYLVLSAGTQDFQPDWRVKAVQEVYARSSTGVHTRTREQFERFFDGLDIVPPYEGAKAEVTYVGFWGAEDAEEADSDGSRWSYCAVARVPEEES
ncbi:SAM-dependent methyltransferase [Actinomadura sp. CNU-125]|uniref:SAM-dependent methyltransferase n=1 Tax=Actinomadura sp. CNU-125 TaxID=1904961 RepID=UPI00096A6DA4|nr:SAM-dependent methyltransferase [Actinomadura sp. CNU-125]